MPALVAGIHVLQRQRVKDVDGRNKSGHDAAFAWMLVPRSGGPVKGSRYIARAAAWMAARMR